MTVTTIDIPDVNGVTRTVDTLSNLLYVEDAAAAANPNGIAVVAVRRDTLTTSEVSADGDNVALKADSRGALHVAVAATALSIAKAEDVASADADVGVPAMMVQKATPANTAGTDGDYEFLQGSAGRLWVSGIITAAATSIGKAEDAAHSSGDAGAFVLSKRTDTAASSAGTDGDYASINTDATGLLWVRIGANDTNYTEDVAAAADPVGPVMLAVRRDTLATSEVSADGDNVALKTDSRGALHVAVAATAKSIAKLEDVASADADCGVPSMAVQKATPADTAGTDGDYEFLQIKSGRLWVSSPPAAAASIGKAEDVASADADVGVPAMAILKATPADTAGTDGDYQMLQMKNGRLWASVVHEGPSFTTVWGLSGAPVASADMSSVASVTDAPTSTQKIVVDKIHASVGTTMSLTFKCQTSGAVISGPHYVLANTTLELNFTGPGSKGPKLATADKTLQCIASVSGNVAINVAYHSEA